jgi:hypothetical protein
MSPLHPRIQNDPNFKAMLEWCGALSRITANVMWMAANGVSHETSQDWVQYKAEELRVTLGSTNDEEGTESESEDEIEVENEAEDEDEVGDEVKDEDEAETPVTPRN